MKEKFVFTCQQCGSQHSKWVGRCSECGAWNSVVEERKGPTGSKGLKSERASAQSIHSVLAESVPRWISDIPEFDDVLGGGLVPGSVVLLGGEPGIGKSTLLLQAANAFSKSRTGLYVTAEESPSQVSLRASRLGAQSDRLLLLSETSLENIFHQIEEIRPQFLIIDSIQTIFSESLESQPGSVGQLRECAFAIIQMAKDKNIPTFLVGHVTKEGAIAGPKVLEHMVDVVLSFEGTSTQSFRLLRSIKNRFGSTNEVGVFEMTQEGLKQVRDPSELFLAERPQKTAGSVIGASMEGSRTILVEVQALVSRSYLAMPRRTSIGLDSNRVSLLVAILEKRAGLRLYDQDVYVNIAGGLKLTEPAMDLAVIAALISSHTGKPISGGSVFFGEVGLGGEVRSVPKAALRLKEAKRIGLKTAYLPKKTVDELKKQEGMELVAVSHVDELVVGT